LEHIHLLAVLDFRKAVANRLNYVKKSKKKKKQPWDGDVGR
jgi:hypothetical protein